ncbi:MAG TPA: hypothetical protein VG253_04120, partial [Streptosporangiaceae bacterium]|nr:hypothetical protein [Streptosporangiaceae bacterium]
ERLELSDALVTLSQTWGIGVLLVEHDVPMVMRTCQRIYALDLGKVIVSGTPAEVRDDPQVVAAFLGPEAAEAVEEAIEAAEAAEAPVAAKTARGVQS